MEPYLHYAVCLHALHKNFSLPAIIKTHKFDYSKSNSSYMFRLHKASIIRPFVSEHVERKLYCCSGTYNYRIYISNTSGLVMAFFVQPKHVAAIGFAIIKAVSSLSLLVLQAETRCHTLSLSFPF
jgi:hypothetical protein